MKKPVKLTSQEVVFGLLFWGMLIASFFIDGPQSGAIAAAAIFFGALQTTFQGVRKIVRQEADSVKTQALKDFEWVTRADWRSFCPCCGNEKCCGHHRACELNKAIQAGGSK